MAISVQPVRTESDWRQFVTFPWAIYRGDPNWVPPLASERRAKLDPARNPFWKNASRELFLARRNRECLGTVAAIVEKARFMPPGKPVGTFGFFECVPDRQAGAALLEAAAGWLRAQGAAVMRGPYNPSEQDEPGILVEGFETRPALLEAHHPRYYQDLLESWGMTPYNSLVARLWRRPPGAQMSDMLPEKLAQVAERAARRPDLRVRRIDTRRWDAEIKLAWEIFESSVASLRDFVPTPLEDFRALAASFRAILDPRLALMAEIGGRPVGYVLALPDAYEALHRVLSRKVPRDPGLLGMLRLFLALRRVRRASFKILVVLPEYQGRGVEAVLIAELARSIYSLGYAEVDMSLTGEENEKSSRFQANLGFAVYRRYNLYQKELS